jgi:hypothetical protein
MKECPEHVPDFALIPSPKSSGQKDNPMKYIILLLSALTYSFLAACAPGPAAVAPASIPASVYATMNCNQARAAYASVTQEVEALSQKQRNAVAGDAIGVFLVLVPVSSLTGGNVEGNLATAKGKKLALEGQLASC